MKRLGKVKILSVGILALSLLLTACSNSSELSEDKVNVVTSFYPIYDFTKQIGGEYVNVINLVPTGVDAHDWTPKSRDMNNLTNSQLFLYNGSGFEGWVDDFISSLKADSKLVSLEVSNGIDLIRMNDQDEEEHDHDAHEHDDHKHDHDFDPHTWLSPKSAIVMAKNIKDALVQVDPGNREYYVQNYEELHMELEQLDAKFEKELIQGNLKSRQFVVSHQSFGYLARDYNLDQVAIMGLAPDTEPTAGDLRRISNLVRDYGMTTIFFEELVSDQLVKTLAKDLNVKTDRLHPLEGITEEQEQANENYVSLMEKNLQNLVKALQ